MNRPESVLDLRFQFLELLQIRYFCWNGRHVAWFRGQFLQHQPKQIGGRCLEARIPQKADSFQPDA